MKPLLNGHATGSVQVGATDVGDGRVQGCFAIRVLRAIFIACKIPAQPICRLAELEVIDDLMQALHRPQLLLEAASSEYGIAAFSAAQPAP